MDSKVALITGATSGIGQICAEALASQGARIVFIARDRTRGSATMTKLRSIAPDQEHAVHYADLSRLREMKRVAAEIGASVPQIDILINNAGVMSPRRRIVTEDELELTFAVNHMAYFVLTCLLRNRLAAFARVVSTSSAAHTRAMLNLNDLQLRTGYGAMRAYSNSKLCNILFTRALARKLEGSGIIANCLHPGFVASNFGADAGGAVGTILKIAKLFALTPEKGAETMIYLASSAQAAATSGNYFSKCQPVAPQAAALDPAAAHRLWETSSQLAGVDL